MNTRQLHFCLKLLHSWTTLHLLHWVRNSPPHTLFFPLNVNNVSNFKERIHLEDKLRNVTSLMGLPPGIATESSHSSESPSWISSLVLHVRTQVHCLQLWTPPMIKAVDFFTQPEPLWAPNSEPSGWLRSRHERCSSKGLKADTSPEALARLHPWVLNYKFQYQPSSQSCPPLYDANERLHRIYRLIKGPFQIAFVPLNCLNSVLKKGFSRKGHSGFFCLFNFIELENVAVSWN